MLNQDEEWLLQEKYHGEKTKGFFTDCERLRAGEPLAYVIGHIPFLNCTIHLDSHPLIPRTETEFWVEKAISVIRARMSAAGFSELVSPPQRQYPERGPGRNSSENPATTTTPLRILDLCAGSGCIGVAVGNALPHTDVTLAEIDPAHLPTIQKNITANTAQFPFKWKCMTSDLFENVVGTFDFILSNPPYIDPTLDRTEPSVKNFEPHVALYGGQGGSELLERIIAAAPTHLIPNGELWLEHEPEQTATIATLAAAHGFIASTHPDQYGTLRYSRLMLQ